MNGPEIVLIAALAEGNRVIGRGMELPWHIPEDLKRFKRLTSGHPLVMGRKTFQSILNQFGRPLPNRRHIVLTRHPERVQHPVAEVFSSVPEALAALRDEPRIFIGGGEAIYTQTLPLAHRLELTIVEGAHEGDVFFPEYESLIGCVFERSQVEAHTGFRFETFIRLE